MTEYINICDTKITSVKSNFDCNINYFSGYQIGTYFKSFNQLGVWVPSKIYATSSPTRLDSNWVQVASGQTISAYRSLVATNTYSNIPGTATSWQLIANNGYFDPYKDISYTWNASGDWLLTSIIVGIPAINLYNYKIQVMNVPNSVSPAPNYGINFNIFGIEENLGGTYRYPLVASFSVSATDSYYSIIPGLFINGNIKIVATTSIGGSNAGSVITYIRIREVN